LQLDAEFSGLNTRTFWLKTKWWMNITGRARRSEKASGEKWQYSDWTVLNVVFSFIYSSINDAVVAYLQHCPNICLHEQRKARTLRTAGIRAEI
jgi:hypothetical protein